MPAIDKLMKSWRWRAASASALFNDAGGALELVDDSAGPIDLDRLPHALELRARAGGEFLRPGIRARTQSLKKLLQAREDCRSKSARTCRCCSQGID